MQTVNENDQHEQSAHDDEIHHETQDAKVTPLIWSGVTLVLVSVFAFAFIAGIMIFLGRGDAAPSALTGAPPVAAPTRLPPEPLLQQEPVADGDRIIAEQQAVLNSYGWVDQFAGKVHIPIERAMELVVEQGVEASQATDATPRPQP